MKADASHEQRFVTEVDGFEFMTRDVEPILHSLGGWLDNMNGVLRINRLACTGLKETGVLAKRAEAIETVLRESADTWSQQWANLKPAQALAGAFDDKAMLLVFGKFNAGKSSFCNFLAERFIAHGRTVQYFHLEGGRIVETSDRFTEGATETTARLQGVCLGERLVLLDTPGLHSMTQENAALTARFTDSADGVLWLTSSTSPGQVQELDDLGRELRRNKPLLPVVTRSDAYDEDEVDGEIVSVLCNKTAQGRAQQEADVKARAEEKLVAMGVDTALLKLPVSISAHVAREQGQTPLAMSEAGFERLYGALLDIIGPALAYKQRKTAEILLHHLEENVLGRLDSAVSPLLAELDEVSQAVIERLERQKEEIAGALWRSVMPTLPPLLERHADARDVGAICRALSQSIFESLAREANRQLSDYVVVLDPSLVQIELENEAGFKEIVVERAGADGPVREVVGVDYGRLHAELGNAVRKSALQLSGDLVDPCRDRVAQLMQSAARLQEALRTCKRDLHDLKRRLRAESVDQDSIRV